MAAILLLGDANTVIGSDRVRRALNMLLRSVASQAQLAISESQAVGYFLTNGSGEGGINLSQQLLSLTVGRVR